MKTIEAIPTDYKGIRFRSKLEATFARTLDIVGKQWVYEPGLADFAIFENAMGSEEEGFVVRPCLFFIELKPTRPTKAYIERLEKSFRLLGRGSRGSVVYVSPYSDERGEIRFVGKWLEGEIGSWWWDFWGDRIPCFDDAFAEASRHRFDLA